MILYGSLLLCAALAALLVYRYDLYEREPWYMLLVTTAAGYGAMWLLGHLEDATLSLFGPPPRHYVIAAAVAATHEELARLAIVVALALFVPKQFNDPMDGIIYGSVVGLGMALEESIFFLRLWQAQGPWLPPTEIIRICGHLVMGGITGFGVGLVRMRLPKAGRILAVCVMVSILLHFYWDWLAFVVRDEGRMLWWQRLTGMALMLGGMLFYGVLVRLGSDYSQRIFSPHAKRELWGWPLRLLKRRTPEPPP